MLQLIVEPAWHYGLAQVRLHPVESFSTHTRLPGVVPQLISAMGSDQGTVGERLGEVSFGFSQPTQNNSDLFC